MNIDVYLFNQINGLAGQSVCSDGLGVFFASYFQYFVVGFLLLFLLFNFKKYVKMVILALGAAVLSRYVFAEIIRYLLPRSRPFVYNQINLLLGKVNESSFPSGHAVFFFAIAAVVYFYNKKAGLIFFLAAFLISLARVFVGVHWPSDILAGAVVGMISGWLVMKIAKKFQK